MSLVDENGRPIAYGWNDEAAVERCKNEPGLKLLSDTEFEELFPELFRAASGGSTQ